MNVSEIGHVTRAQMKNGAWRYTAWTADKSKSVVLRKTARREYNYAHVFQSVMNGNAVGLGRHVSFSAQGHVPQRSPASQEMSKVFHIHEG